MARQNFKNMLRIYIRLRFSQNETITENVYLYVFSLGMKIYILVKKKGVMSHNKIRRRKG